MPGTDDSKKTRCLPDCGRGYYCHVCRDRVRSAARLSLTPRQLAYDMDAIGGTFAKAECCSCHILAPCSFCESCDE